jgi:thioredoxin reductase
VSENGVFMVIFEGVAVPARAGESVAAALIAHGVQGLRITRTAAERGIFCGMGVCQDCLIDVDGVPGQRACMTIVDRPLTVRRQRHGQPVQATASRPPITLEDLRVERPELLVIGAGPGGLSAAMAARRAGVDVLVLDERRSPGGQYFKPVATGAEALQPPDAQHREGLALVAAARAAGVVIRTGVTVWGAFKPLEFAASDAEGAFRILPRAVIVATGALERGWPVPGWELPGVMTTGAAQTLWRTARRLPGRRVLVAGNGPLNLQLAAELHKGGAKVVAVAEAARAPWRSPAALAAMALASPALVAEGLGYRATCLAGGVPILHDHVVTAVAQGATGLRVTLDAARGGGAARQFDTDIVCLGYGLDPSNELLRALGCWHDHDPAQGRLVTWRDGQGRTSVESVYALGDCTGLGGARVALADGWVAGLAAAADLGHAPGPALAREGRAAAARGRRHRRFQQALWQLYHAPPRPLAQVPDATLICRCEEVRFGDARAALAEGHDDAGALKRATRIGMGPCQGRLCRPLLEALISEASGRAPDEYSGFAPRPPIRPVRISDLAGRCQP